MSQIVTSSRPARPSGRPLVRLLLLAGVVLGSLLAVPVGSAHAAPARSGHHHHHAARHHHHARHHHRRHHHHAHHHVAGRSGRVAHAMGIAAREKGKPYAYGAAGPRAFDCSGLTFYAFHHAGFRGLPRTAAAQSHFARHIARSHMHRGDLIFFTGRGGVYHVGLYVGMSHGRRLVLHSPYPGRRVHVEPVWTNAWFAGTLR
jgi:cell wall-associated NlpC family hydrolase